MNSLWAQVHNVAKRIAPADSVRLTNLAIAAACVHSRKRGPKKNWTAIHAKSGVSSLALSKIDLAYSDMHEWGLLARLAMDASCLGNSLSNMYSWAAAHQAISSEQKVLGAFATPSAFADTLARTMLTPLDAIRVNKVIDPSAGAGNLLLGVLATSIQNKSRLEARRQINSLFGIEIDPCARELCCLLIYIFGLEWRAELESIASNIRVENALTRCWNKEFEAFDALIMNPPWESLRHKVDTSMAVERESTIERLEKPVAGANGLPLLFSAHGVGDKNLFKAFVELAPHLIRKGGRLGALIPASFASDAGMTELRKRYFEQFEIAKWSSFENRAKYFPIDGRYKFGLLAATRSNEGTQRLYVRAFCKEPEEVDSKHTLLNRADIKLLGGEYHILPEIFDRKELQVIRKILNNGEPFFNSSQFGEIIYRREIDLTIGKKRKEFIHWKDVPGLRWYGDSLRSPEGVIYTPLVEGRFINAYDCFEKSWVAGKGRTAKWEHNGAKSINQCQSQYVVEDVRDDTHRLAICDVTAATNTRTVLASFVPQHWRCGNTAPTLMFQKQQNALAALAILNSLVFDWLARRLVSGNHLNKFCLEGMVWPSIDDGQYLSLLSAASDVCVSKPRAGIRSETVVKISTSAQGKCDVLSEKKSAMDALIEIEKIVARGYGLDSKDLAKIYSDDRSDRRGFWRYFDNVPASKEMVRRVLSSFDQN